MENIESEAQTNSPQSSLPSLVESFCIEGLYGYRSVSLSSEYAATVLIAKNGAGKTTLLGALDAFLKGQFGRLSNIKFSKIVCKLRALKEPLELTSEDVDSLTNLSESSELYLHAKTFGIDPTDFLDFIINDYLTIRKSNKQLGENEIFETIVSKVRYSTNEAKKICDRLAESVSSKNKNIERIRAHLNIALSGVEIVYLPTYRRIELALTGDPEETQRTGSRKRKSIQARLGISRRSLFNADIQFGLADISERLANLNQEILINSNQGYREISANIINDLLSGAFDRENPSPEEIPDKESLSLFFSRIKDSGRRMGPYGPYHPYGPYADYPIPDIDKIYSGENFSSQSSTSKFLIYFLSKLNTVIQATRDIELVVEEFINNCNRYLSAQDESMTQFDESKTDLRPSRSIDDKVLKLDRRTLTVNVESIAAKRKISLDSLSSGEKQMISLFARLYLYPGTKIVLIDEPELSLSIDWQRKILLDVVNAPSCAQVIAITHSPFVFDNELEPYAKGLALKIDTDGSKQDQVDDEDDLDV